MWTVSSLEERSVVMGKYLSKPKNGWSFLLIIGELSTRERSENNE